MQASGPLLLIGCGKMGGALLSGWLDHGVPPETVHVVEPGAAALQPFAGKPLHRHGTLAEAPDDLAPAVVMLAVKPQMMDEALKGLERFATPGTVFLSIAAGKTLAYFEERLGPEAAIVRAMPNTPAAVGRGMTVLCANSRVSTEQRKLCESLSRAVGEADWVEDEGLLDVVTAVSGGGPAYVFLLTECLAKAGERLGLAPELALRLARETVAGSGELLHRAEEHPSVLRQNVTSPAGTTLEALNVLMAEGALEALMAEAIAAATRRSRELAS
jgi:pyrroline-5-carboxylate reductase